MKHSMDILFILLLFTAFSLCGSLEVYLGSKTYQTIEDQANDLTTLQMTQAYFRQKVHQSLSFSCPSSHILCLHYENYQTYIYYDKHCIKELTTTKSSIDSLDGEIIFNEIDTFQLQNHNDQLIITINDQTIYVKGVTHDA